MIHFNIIPILFEFYYLFRLQCNTFRNLSISAKYVQKFTQTCIFLASTQNMHLQSIRIILYAVDARLVRKIFWKIDIYTLMSERI